VDTRDCYERAYLPSPLIVRIDALRAAIAAAYAADHA
jgi:hypothetical protein